MFDWRIATFEECCTIVGFVAADQRCRSWQTSRTNYAGIFHSSIVYVIYGLWDVVVLQNLSEALN